MGAVASQITSLTIVYSTVYSDADQRKHQSSASLAFVQGIHRGPVNSPHKWPVTRKMFPFDDVIMLYSLTNKASYRKFRPAFVELWGQPGFPRWPGNTFCMWWRGIHWSPVNSPHKATIMRSFDVLLVVKPNKLLNKRSNCRSFVTLIRRLCDVGDNKPGLSHTCNAHTISYDTTQHNATQRDMTWHDMTWHMSCHVMSCVMTWQDKKSICRSFATISRDCRTHIMRIRYHMIQRSITQHKGTWHDMTWHDTISYDTTQHNATQRNMTWHDMTWHVMSCHDMSCVMTWQDKKSICRSFVTISRDCRTHIMRIRYYMIQRSITQHKGT